MDNNQLYCRVCGYREIEPPWGMDGNSPSDAICPCCGVEHGYEDSNLAAIRSYRQDWLAKGAPWWDRHTPNDGLATEDRLSRVPPEFR
jgi:hypothetical protein